MFLKYLLSVLVCLSFIATSCIHETDLSTLKDVSFTNDISPILAGNCTQSECHNSNSHEEELFSLETYEDVISEGGVKAGDARGSKFYQVISNHGGETMPPPPRSMLSSDQIKLVYVWIEQGAKNN